METKMIDKPMLAGTAKQMEKLRYPMLVSPKLDGIRCLVEGQGRVLSRKFKDIPNHHIRETLQDLAADLPGVTLDGELMVGNTFQQCSSGVMSRDGQPDFTYWVFDCVVDSLEEPFEKRLLQARDILERIGDPRVRLVEHCRIANQEALSGSEEAMLKNGFEGLMIRCPAGPYKCGRSTEREGYLLKLKRFLDSEAEVIGFVEQMTNVNELQTDELGYAKRSSAKDGKVPAGTLGKFLVRDLQSGLEFRCGTGEGLTAELRQQIWNDQDSYLGRIIKYKYQPHGVKLLPRLPIWLGFRDPADC